MYVWFKEEKKNKREWMTFKHCFCLRIRELKFRMNKRETNGKFHTFNHAGPSIFLNLFFIYFQLRVDWVAVINLLHLVINLCVLSEVANVLRCDSIVSEFARHSRYYVHFWTNTLWKGMNQPIPPAKLCDLVSEWVWTLVTLLRSLLD